jgi:hypothetical protein
MMGSDPNDLLSQKRWLAFLEGGLLPIISLTSLHFFTKYDNGKNVTEKEVIVEKIIQVPVEKEVIVEKIVEVPVEKEVIVEKIVEVPVSNFQETEDETPIEEVIDINVFSNFRYKFKNDRTEGIVWIDGGNIYNFNTPTILNC